MPEIERSPSPDDALSAVADEHRRAVLRELDHTDGTAMPFERLVDRVAARVRSTNAGQSGADHRRRVRTALHHTHLPKLEDFDLVVYDTESMRVRSVSGELERELLAIAESHSFGD